jgi:hypothetical protein
MPIMSEMPQGLIHLGGRSQPANNGLRSYLARSLSEAGNVREREIAVSRERRTQNQFQFGRPIPIAVSPL